MLETADIEETIEQIRSQLERLVMEKNDFLDESVIKLSQQLDRFIVECQMRAKSRLKRP